MYHTFNVVLDGPEIIQLHWDRPSPAMARYPIRTKVYISSCVYLATVFGPAIDNGKEVMSQLSLLALSVYLIIPFS